VNEIELRFALSADEHARFRSLLPWGPEKRVVDLTLGPDGARSMQLHGWVVRLRRSDDSVRLEFKERRDGDWSSWTEYGTEVGDFADTVRILTAIGLRPGLLLERVRRTAVEQPVTYSLDDVRGLGHFLEIEVAAEDGCEAEARELIEQARERLELGSRKAERPYGELMLRALDDDPDARADSDRAIRELLDVEQPV
jgi:predicted adenylyl cyclase CyaB